MNNNQLAFLKMLHVTIAYLRHSVSLFSGKPRIMTSLEKLENLTGLIETNHQIQIDDLTGLYEGKSAGREALGSLATRVGKGLAAAFYQDRMPAETEKARNGYINFIRRTDQEVWPVVKGLYDLAMANLDRVSDFDITRPLLEEMRLAAETFYASLDTNEMTRDGRVRATERIVLLIDEARNELKNSMDLMVESVTKEANPEFYAGYLKVRDITVRGRRHQNGDETDGNENAMVTFSFTDATTGNPVEGVTIALDGVMLEDISDDSGEIYLDDLTPGTHVCAASAPGYRSREWNTPELMAGEEYMFEEILTPEG